jgi:DNA ligase (NAD+)
MDLPLLVAAPSVAARSRTLRDRLETLTPDELETEVRHHNALYWEKNAPEIDDPTFDVLVERLRALRPDSPVLDDLGSRPSVDRRFQQVTHTRPMLSLEKCYDDETLAKWREKIRGAVVVTPKIDGVACSLRYDAKGTLVLAATRGDGRVGDDITENARHVQGIPATLSSSAFKNVAHEVRGEVHMALSRFRAHYAAEFANFCNLTAGALKHKESERSASYGLRFYAYDIDGSGLPRERDKSAYLAALGFPCPPTRVVEEGEDLAAAYRVFLDQRASFDFETDGVVMKADNVALQEQMGLTAHHPRYAIAYKFQGESADTHLVAVEWSLGRTGVITPVAVVEPVLASGAMVSRASLHHAGFLAKLGLTSKARVEIVRRGGVIPKVERVIAAEGEAIPVLDTCPSCGAPTHLEGDFLYCSLPDACPDVVKSRVGYFMKSIDIVGIGDRIMSALLERGLVKTPADLYRLSLEQLVALDRMGEKTASKILAEIDAKRRLPFATFVAALGIDEIGPTVAENITSRFDTIESLRAATIADLSALHGVGESIAHALTTGLAHVAKEIDDLLTVVTITRPVVVEKSDHPLSGKSVVFTGKMKHMDRKVAQRLVKERGGKTPSSVTSDLDFLVIGDDGSPLLGDGEKSTKHQAAEKLIAKGSQVQIIPESDFVKMVE